MGERERVSVSMCIKPLECKHVKPEGNKLILYVPTVMFCLYAVHIRMLMYSHTLCFIYGSPYAFSIVNYWL